MNLKTITWAEYLALFEDILNNPNPPAPYDNPAYFDYLKLNHTRQNRWLKRGAINEELKLALHALPPQEWILITEPWCGDAAHSNPFIYMMAKENPSIDLKIVLRDEPPFLIDQYLTNGGKSIPILIIRDKEGIDRFVWGPRPEPCQAIFLDLKARNADFEEQKITLQQWYNQDNGETIQREFILGIGS
jgi:curved DNA-binding protein CbpA